MTATARRMRRGARTITTGKQLRGQLSGLSTHVGPNALLRSTSYPAVSAAGPGPLTAPTVPSGGFWRIDGTNELDTGNHGLCTNWTSGVSTPYVYNNHPSNLGGIVPGGGMVIDGFTVPAGSYVFQFMDLSASNCYLQDPAPGMVFRGCRNRAPDSNAPGFWNASSSPAYAGEIYFLYCDTGGTGPSSAQVCAVPIDVLNYGGMTCYRNYISYMTNAIQPGSQTASPGTLDLIENFTEKVTNYSGNHLEAFNLEGGQTNYRMLRNSILFAATDENSVPVIDTACIYTTQSTSFPFTGTGTNPDGTVGYRITGNYVGGTGYCFYWGYDSGVTGSVVNMVAASNLVTQSIYPVTASPSGGASGLGGGYNGPTTFEAPWGTFGNSQSGNLWADGPDAGTSFM